MALGWLTVLKMVPWGDVISNAPKIAKEAGVLWDKVKRKPQLPELGNVDPQPKLSPGIPSLPELQEDLITVHAAVSDLHKQMLASSELLKALADQNTQLIKRVDVNRTRIRWLAGITFFLVLLIIANFVLLVIR